MTPILLLAAVTSAFNLECTGTAYHINKLMGPQQNVHTFAVNYRVDLSTGRFCTAPCTVTHELAKVTETQIIFELEQKDEIDDTLVYANREDGDYMYRRRWYDGTDMEVDMAQGECRRTPFTGFPPRKF